METYFWIGLLVYLSITLSISLIFGMEPVGSILWILFPVILPIVWFRNRKDKIKDKRLCKEILNHKSTGLHHIPSENEFFNMIKNK